MSVAPTPDSMNRDWGFSLTKDTLVVGSTTVSTTDITMIAVFKENVDYVAVAQAGLNASSEGEYALERSYTLAGKVEDEASVHELVEKASRQHYHSMLSSCLGSTCHTCHTCAGREASWQLLLQRELLHVLCSQMWQRRRQGSNRRAEER